MDNTDKRLKEAYDAGRYGTWFTPRTHMESNRYAEGKRVSGVLQHYGFDRQLAGVEVVAHGFVYGAAAILLNLFPLVLGAGTAYAISQGSSGSFKELTGLVQFLVLTLVFGYIYTLPLYYFRGRMLYLKSMRASSWKTIYSFIFAIQIIFQGLALLTAVFIFSYDEIIHTEYDFIAKERHQFIPLQMKIWIGLFLFVAGSLTYRLYKQHNHQSKVEIPSFYKWIFIKGVESVTARD